LRTTSQARKDLYIKQMGNRENWGNLRSQNKIHAKAIW